MAEEYWNRFSQEVQDHAKALEEKYGEDVWKREHWYLNITEKFLRESSYSDNMSSKFAIPSVSIPCIMCGPIHGNEQIVEVEIVNGAAVPVSNDDKVAFIKGDHWFVGVTDITPEAKFKVINDFASDKIPESVSEAPEPESDSEYEP